MSKRRNTFERITHDKYKTPERGVWPLIRHLPPGVRYAEPCAAEGKLIKWLNEDGFRCTWASDIEPERPVVDMPIMRLDAMKLTDAMLRQRRVDMIITNPPWTRPILHELIKHFRSLRDTWLLFDVDWMFNGESAHLVRCAKLAVAVPRLKWIENTEHGATDNVCWFFFPKGHYGDGPTVIPRNG